MTILDVKNVKVGIYLEQGKIMYENNGFKILEYPSERYKDDDKFSNDKIYHIKIDGENRPTFNDICMTLFYLLKNKIYDGAFNQYKGQVLDTIIKAERERKEINKQLDEWM